MTSPEDSLRKKKLLVAVLLLVSVFAVASPGLRNEFIFDDESRITGNYDIRELSHLKTRLVYPYEKGPELYRNDPLRPLVYVTYTLNYHWGELDPFGYHALDVLLHAMVAVMVFAVTKLIALRYVGADAALRVAAMVAFLFALHPLNIAAALYSYSRSMTLFSWFALAALYAHVRMRAGAPARTAVVALLFVLALASRQTAIVLPIVLIAYDLTVGSAGRLRSFASDRRARAHHATLIAIAILYLGLHYAYFGGVGDLAIGTNVRWDRWPYLAHQPYALLRYVQLLVLPIGQSFQHAIHPGDVSDATLLLSALIVAALMLLGVLAYSRWESPVRNAVAFASLFFFAFLLPVSSVLPTAWVMDERRVYLSSAAFFAAAVIALAPLHRRTHLQRPIEIGCAVVLIALAGASVAQARLGRTAESQWRHVLTHYPESEYALENLALIHAERGEDREAARYFVALLQKYPGNFKALCEFAEFNVEHGRLDLATRALDNAAKIGPRHWRVRDLRERIAAAERGAGPSRRSLGTDHDDSERHDDSDRVDTRSMRD